MTILESNFKSTKKGNKRAGQPKGARLAYDATPSKNPKNKIKVSFDREDGYIAGDFVVSGRYGKKELKGKSHVFHPDLYLKIGKPDRFGKPYEKGYSDLARDLWDGMRIVADDGRSSKPAPKRVVDEVKKQTAALIKKEISDRNAWHEQY